MAGVVSALLASSLDAQASGPAEATVGKPIQDNSFLIEEAYNQERGVVQHIGVFERTRPGSEWLLVFTQEWPVASQRHQLSVTVPVQSVTESSGHGLGDVLLNYRYQLVGTGSDALYVAPRASAILPTGDHVRDRGSGAAGVQLNLPVSLQLSPQLVTHWNAGGTLTPQSRNAAGDRATTRGYNAGASAIWLYKSRLNFMLELAWEQSEVVSGPGTRLATRSVFLSPGLRAALDFTSGLQIVPGFAIPLGLGPSRGERALLLYLSLEHPFGS